MNKNVTSFYHTNIPHKYTGRVSGETLVHFCDVLARNVNQAYDQIEYMRDVEFNAGDIAVDSDGVYTFDGFQWWNEYWYEEKYK